MGSVVDQLDVESGWGSCDVDDGDGVGRGVWREDVEPVALVEIATQDC